MAYSEDVAKLITGQLERFYPLRREQLAGHTENLDFWVGEIRHALAVLDGYESRFQRLRSAQPIQPMNQAARRVSDTELREVRRSLTDALYRLLVRLVRESLIPEARLRAICEELSVGIDPADLPSSNSTR